MSKKRGSGQPPKVEPVIFPERPEPFDLSSFKCPRCQTVISAEYYGPCQSCLDALKANYDRGSAPKDSVEEAEGFMPKMHVTPNAVALKDD